MDTADWDAGANSLLGAGARPTKPVMAAVLDMDSDDLGFLEIQTDKMSFPTMNEYCLEREKRARDARAAEVRAAEIARGTVFIDKVCNYWQRDRCALGDKCRHLHVFIPDKVPLCKYIEGNCPQKNTCIFRHYYLPHEQRQAPLYDPTRSSAMSTS